MALSVAEDFLGAFLARDQRRAGKGQEQRLGQCGTHVERPRVVLAAVARTSPSVSVAPSPRCCPSAGNMTGSQSESQRLQKRKLAHSLFFDTFAHGTGSWRISRMLSQQR